ncbi:MAG: DNA-binding protein [Candidatus Korarchaeota archaeon]|nr:DNA-binding protein [Candidatus Korarchaeota archaeon]NIU84672.1 DUF296 domain-containing protein [Candidatus Thorarchaeota archaeon]NIW14693.1 DUF296 domain-containing protein [Candidatus Thorarchaeota archaeon]NIW52764.1 DUF296 domain-containing protein [Candidatus Korarchaeota archaeon]
MHVKEMERQLSVILEKGEEIISSLEELARNRDFSGFFLGIGAVSDPEVGYFKREKGEFIQRRLNGEFEVLSLLGNIGSRQGEVVVHGHIILGDDEYNTKGGHLVKATVSVTLELSLFRSSKLIREKDEITGLHLIKKFS